jgi:signal transduction histidine kinase
MAIKQAIADNSLISVSEHATGQHGLMEGARSGLYSVLPARGSLIGLLALEDREPNGFSYRDVELLNGFIEPLALAIDNARWFSRLRTVGADEERTRIARDLHDRIGQSLAYVGFELDRLAKTCADGEEVGRSVERLSGDIRGVIGEVRDTLYDLRTDVNDDTGLVETLRVFADRVEQRTSLKINLSIESNDRLPILQEREMWRIAQEALVNIEKHAEASNVEVSWLCEGSDAVLTIIDDGKGFQVGADGRNDSYGILGMRERAASIGARFDVMSEPGEGSTVRCVLGV